MRYLALTLLLLATPAMAQQRTAAQTALAINQAVSQLAMTIDAAQRQIVELQAENAALKAKCGEPCNAAAPAKPR